MKLDGDMVVVQKKSINSIITGFVKVAVGMRPDTAPMASEAESELGA